MTSPHLRLLKRVRVLAQHAETIAKACRMIEKQITTSHLLSIPVDEPRLDKSVRTIEKRALQMVRTIGITYANLYGDPPPD